MSITAIPFVGWLVGLLVGLFVGFFVGLGVGKWSRKVGIDGSDGAEGDSTVVGAFGEPAVDGAMGVFGVGGDPEFDGALGVGGDPDVEGVLGVGGGGVDGELGDDGELTGHPVTPAKQLWLGSLHSNRDPPGHGSQTRLALEELTPHWWFDDQHNKEN